MIRNRIDPDNRIMWIFTKFFVIRKHIAVCSTSTAPLRELTCHMGSHSITCHPAEVTFPPNHLRWLLWSLRAPTFGMRLIRIFSKYLRDRQIDGLHTLQFLLWSFRRLECLSGSHDSVILCYTLCIIWLSDRSHCRSAPEPSCWPVQHTTFLVIIW